MEVEIFDLHIQGEKHTHKSEMRNSESCPTQNTGDQNQEIVFIYAEHIHSGSDGAMRMSTAITSATVTYSHVRT